VLIGSGFTKKCEPNLKKMFNARPEGSGAGRAFFTISSFSLL